jgi:[amino group carrier protein]-L-2-aminoadipate 6-kinase
MAEPVLVVKVGGSVVSDLPPAWWDDAAKVAATRKVILVHGWSAPLRAMHANTGRQPIMLVNQHGHRGRFTDARVLEDIRVASVDLRARIRGELGKRGVSAVAADGATAKVLVAEVRRQRWWVDGRLTYLDNIVGPIRDVDATRLGRLLRAADTLVLTPLATSPQYPAVNTDADRAAARIAMAAVAADLVMVTDVPGIQIDGATVAELSREEVSPLAPFVTGGMKKKVSAAFTALDAGIGRVVIGRGTISDLLAGRTGTRVCRR